MDLPAREPPAVRLRKLRAAARSRIAARPALAAMLGLAALVLPPLVLALPRGAAQQAPTRPPAPDPLAAISVDLPATMHGAIPFAPVTTRSFVQEASTVGSIDVNEDASVQVIAPYQGRLLEIFARLGDDVRAGQPLYVIDSPDLLQAESTLVAAAGVLQLTSRVLQRARELFPTRGVSQHDLEQAISDQQSAEAAFNAARDAVRLFGKTPAEVERMVATRRVDGRLLVVSPITGRVTARNAQPGLFVQQGATPALLTVTDLSTMWMMAMVPESQVARFQPGAQVRARVPAHPGREFLGDVRLLGPSVDPATRRVLVRSDIEDPGHLLRPGMFCDFVITTGAPVEALAVPDNAVAREGDGSFSVWVTSDGGQRFSKRSVRLGLRQDGFREVLEGLAPGDVVATDRSIFLSAALVSMVR